MKIIATYPATASQRRPILAAPPVAPTSPAMIAPPRSVRALRPCRTRQVSTRRAGAESTGATRGGWGSRSHLPRPAWNSECLRLAVDEVVHHHEIERAAVGDVVDAGPKCAVATGELDASDDRGVELGAHERQAVRVGPARREEAAQAVPVLVEQLDRAGVVEVHVREHRAEAGHAGRC